MNQFGKEEKFFVSCFVERCDVLLRPSLGKIFSLHTFIAGEKPLRKQQEKRLATSDPIIAERLRLISDKVDDEVFYKKQIRKLQREAGCITETFESNFRVISEWLWLVESDKARARVRRSYNEKRKIIDAAFAEKEEVRRKFFLTKVEEENKYFEIIKKNNQCEESKRKIAEAIIIASGSSVRSKVDSKTWPGTLRPSDSQICFICNGFGKTSSGRNCAKCSGRGFIRT